MNLHNKYKEFEKRIKYNENVVKDDNQTLIDLDNRVDALSTSVATLDNTVDTLSSSQQTQDASINQLTEDLNQAQTQLNQQADEIETQNTAISSFVSTLDAHTDTIDFFSDIIDSISETLDSHADTLGSHTNTLSSHTGSLNSHSNELNTISDTLDLHSLQIESNSNYITTLTNILNNHTSTLSTHTQRLNTYSASISELEDTVEDNIEILSNHATTLSNHEDTLDNQASALNTLSGTISNLSDDVESLETSLESQATDIENLETSLESQATDIENLEDTIQAQTTAIQDIEDALEDHSDILQSHSTTLDNHTSVLSGHSQIIGSLDLPFYGDSILEFENFANQCASEPLYYYGGRAKVNGGTKGPNGPFGYLFTRVTPATQFSGVIRLYLSNIPADMTSASLNFYINGNSTGLNLNFITEQDYDLEINFDFFALSISNVFRIQFTDWHLKNMVLDFIEIITENGRNFMCLNRLDYLTVSTFKTSTNTDYVYMGQLSNVGGYEEALTPRTNPDVPFILQIPGKGTPVTTNFIRNQVKKKVSLGYYQTVIMQLTVATENSTLFRTDTNATTYTQYFNNVYFAFMGYHWRTGPIYYCGTLLNQQVFIGGLDIKVTDIPTINLIELPNQFITCTTVEDWRILSRTAYKEIGYILLHNSGKLFYIPEDDCAYFIEIGFGTQPNAYIQPDYETIYIYYHFNNTVYKKELKLNTTTNKWELTNNVKIYPGVIEIFEVMENCHIRTLVNGTRQIVYF